MEKSLLCPMLRRNPNPLTLTHSTLCLQALKGTTLHRTTFLSVGSKREDLQSMLEIFLGRKIDAETSICGVEPLLLARSLNWSSRAVCSCLVARAHHSQRTSATYARSSAGPRIHYLDAPQTQPSSARLQRQQAGRGRLKPGVRQNRVTTALGARRFLGLPLRNATCLLASTPCPSAFNQLWRWGPGRSRLSSSSWSARRQIEFLVELKTSHT